MFALLQTRPRPAMMRFAMADDAACWDRNANLASQPTGAISRALPALILLLLINMFNYIDRYVLVAVEPDIRKHFFPADDPDARAKTGLLATAFLISYMVASPIFGRLADRMPRWPLVGISVILWSLASGASGLALTFGALLITRMFVGIGEAGYGPSAPTIIADLYPVRRRGSALSWFYMAIPVGGALGYLLGGFAAERWGWRAAFYLVVLPGLALGTWAFLMREPRRGQADAVHVPHKAQLRDYLLLVRTPSYLLDTAGMVALTFSIVGLSFWMPDYLHGFRKAGSLGDVNLKFGGIALIAGVTATLSGGYVGDLLRTRLRGAYFIVSGTAIWLSCPLIMLVLWTPFPAAWFVMFLAMFFLFFNTGPSNTILANVTHPSVRATAFAFNILLVHLLGDAISPPLLGAIIGKGSAHGWRMAFVTVSLITAFAGALWMLGARYVDRDTERAPHLLDGERES